MSPDVEGRRPLCRREDPVPQVRHDHGCSGGGRTRAADSREGTPGGGEARGCCRGQAGANYIAGAGCEVPRGTQNSVVVAVNIGLFTDVEGYKDNIDDLAKGIKGLPRQPGVDEILIPGEPEDRVYDQRKAEGIPLPTGAFGRWQEVAAKFGGEMPATR